MANNPFYDSPRELTAMDMKLEKKVFDSFMSVLMLAEQVPNEQETTVTLTLGELRQHVQWCQHAARLVDMAVESQKNYAQQRIKTDRALAQVALYQQEEELLDKINSTAANLADRIRELHGVRNRVKRETKRDG